MIKKLFLIISATLLLSASQQQTQTIEGKWKWIRSEFITRGMTEPTITTPKSQKHDIVLNIKAKEIEVIKKDDVVETVPYLFYTQPDDAQIIRVSMPQNDSPFYISSGPVFFRGDTMIIGGTYNDAGQDQFYIKLNKN